jgi:hypothetical protein
MIPDRLPDGLRELIAQFEPGSLQFEVGVQTFNPDVAALISRRQDVTRLSDNLRWLRDRTGVHVHADLIVGLPGEDMGSFGAGFDRLVELGPREIQVGMLKRLRGTPIVRHTEAWKMVYSPNAPYEVLQTSLIDFATMQRLRRFARYWDLISNSGNFIEATPMIWGDRSPFEQFMALADWVFETEGRNHGISLQRLAALVFDWLVRRRSIAAPVAAEALLRDYTRGGRSDVPPFLREFASVLPPMPRRATSALPARQARHAQGAQKVQPPP